MGTGETDILWTSLWPQPLHVLLGLVVWIHLDSVAAHSLSALAKIFTSGRIAYVLSGMQAQPLCSLPPLTTRIPFAHYLTLGGSSPPPPHPTPCNQACAGGDSFLRSPFPSCHFLGAGGRWSCSQTYLTHHFFQNLIMMGTDPGPGLPRCSRVNTCTGPSCGNQESPEPGICPQPVL